MSIKQFITIMVIATVALVAIAFITGGDKDKLGYQSLGNHEIGTLASPVYLEPTESTSTDIYETSSTLTFRTDNVSEIDMNLGVVASTSAVIHWVYYFSDDGTNFFSEDGNTDTSDVVMTHGATAYTHSWTPGITTIASKHIDVSDSLSNINTEYFRVTFTVATASTTLYASINTKENN